MKRLLRNRRAVSAVFTTVMLILIVVAGMTAVLAFLVSYVESYQSGQGSASLEFYIIEDVWFDGGNITISVFNYGENGEGFEIEVLEIYVNNEIIIRNKWEFMTDTPDFTEIIPGEHRAIIIEDMNLDPGRYEFKVVTRRSSYVSNEAFRLSEIYLPDL